MAGIGDEVVFRRIQHPHPIGDQLHHVLVAGDDEDRVAIIGGLAGERADDVVGLEALGLEDGNAKGLERAADVGKLLRQIGGHLGAVGLVALVLDVNVGLRLGVELAVAGHGCRLLVAERWSREIEGSGQVLRIEIGAQLAQHVDEDKRRARGKSGLVRHGALPAHGVIGAEDERHRVDEKDAPLGTGRLSGNRECGLGLSERRRGWRIFSSEASQNSTRSTKQVSSFEKIHKIHSNHRCARLTRIKTSNYSTNMQSPYE